VRREAVEAEEGKEEEAVTLTSLSVSTLSLGSSE
jgi:hypothetical protein